MTDHEFLKALRQPTENDPLRIMVSACFTGRLCGYDGSDNGSYPSVKHILPMKNVRIVPFCPEHFSFGTPREMCDIHGGDGRDVLDGKAKVLSDSGLDWTEGMVRASEEMLRIAKENEIELAVLMDVSAACGSQVIYDGNRFHPDKKYQIGMGVCAAQLHRAGFKVISQRDFAALELLYAKLDPQHRIDPEKADHLQHPWTIEYFGLKA